MRFDIVIPTIGRTSLWELLRCLADARGPLPQRIIVVDDRRSTTEHLTFAKIPERIRGLILLVEGRAAGPAAARNTGWRHANSPWIAFLDDDVIVDQDWLERLRDDIASLEATDAGSQALVRVPLPTDRAPTDWERNVHGLQSSAWITADIVYRRAVLEELNGFDERFKRAYREDADFAIRVQAAGYRIRRGTRTTAHPVRAADAWISVRLQAGNADDVLMAALHGPHWRQRARAPRGRWPYHLASVMCFTAWAAITADFAWRRIAPGPRTPKEIGTIVATSALIPFAAVYHRTRALLTIAAQLRGSAQ